MTNERNINSTKFIHTTITTYKNCKEVSVNTECLVTLKSKRVVKYYRDNKIVTRQERYVVEMFLADAEDAEFSQTTEYK